MTFFHAGLLSCRIPLAFYITSFCLPVQVEPGESYTYYWTVTVPHEQASPCFSSLYYSAHDYPKDLYSGLVGPLVVCKKGTLNEEGKSRDYSKN